MDMIDKNKTILKPWGKEIILEKKKNYCVKKLWVRQGEKLSLQSHKNRFEVWTVLTGKIEAQKGSSKILLEPGDFTKINKNEKHRITGLKESWVLEVAFGQVRQNDIIRFEDNYGRGKK